MAQEQNFVIGDTLKPAVAILQYEDDDGVTQPFDLTGKTVTFHMIDARSPFTTKINNQPAVIVTPLEGKVRYDWQGVDVDEAGIFFAWFIVYDGGPREHFPKGYDYVIFIHPIDGSQITT